MTKKALDILYESGPWDILRYTWGIDADGRISYSEVVLRCGGELVIPVNDRKFRSYQHGNAHTVCIEDIPEDVISRYKLLKMADNV